MQVPGRQLLLSLALLGGPATAASEATSEAQISALDDAASIAAYQESLPSRVTDPVERAVALRLLGSRWEHVQSMEQARAAYDQSVKLLETLPASVELVYSLSERSYMDYLLSGEPAEFCPDRARALEIARAVKDPEAQVHALLRHAFCHDSDGQWQQGLEELQEAMRIARDNALEHNIQSMVANASGLLYRRLHLHDRAYESFREAYELWMADGDVPDYFNMLHSMVGAAVELGRWQLAEDHVQSLFEVADQNPGDNDYLFFAHFNQGRLALARREFERAEAAYSEALRLRNTTPEQHFVGDAYLSRAEARVWLSDFAGTRADLERFQTDYPREGAGEQRIARLGRALEERDPDQVLAVMLEFRQQEAEEHFAFFNANARLISQEHENRISEYEASLLKHQLALRDLELAQAANRERLSTQTQLNLGLAAALLLGVTMVLLRSQRRDRRRAQTDYLTGIANRGALFGAGFRFCDRARRRNLSLAVILFDLDRFKSINDSFGHHVGDRVIIETVSAVAALLQGDEMVGRMGGEEFLAILPGTDREEAMARAEAMRRAIEEAGFEHAGDRLVNFTASLGVACRNPDDNFQSLVNRADQALYRAKHAGRNQVEFLAYGEAAPTGDAPGGASRQAPRSGPAAPPVEAADKPLRIRSA